MSTFWKGLSQWCDERDKATTERKNRKHGTADKRLTKAVFINELHSLEGQVGRWFDQAGTMLVQRYDEIITRRLGDTVQVCTELVRQHTDNMQTWVDNTFKLYNNAMHSYFRDMTKALEAKERNDSGRFLATQEMLNVVHGTQIGLFENLTSQIQALKEPQVIYEPSLDWLMDNLDELVKFGIAMEAMRDNHAPANIAKVHAVKSLCAMLPVSILEAGKALNDAVKSWGITDSQEIEALAA